MECQGPRAGLDVDIQAYTEWYHIPLGVVGQTENIFMACDHLVENIKEHAFETAICKLSAILFSGPFY